jgi:Tfp pilus assembly protein PilO
MKIGPREQLILVIIGLFVLFVAIAALIVWPQYQKQQSLDSQIAAAETQLQTSKTLLAQRQQIKNRTAATDAQWLALASLVPENPDLPSLIIEIQDVAFASGVQINAITPGEPVGSADNSYVAVPLQVGIVGTWADTVDFLKNLNKLNRGIREVNYTSTVAPPISGNPLLPTYSVTTQTQLEAYTIPASAAAASAPATTSAAPAAPAQ